MGPWGRAPRGAPPVRSSHTDFRELSECAPTVAGFLPCVPNACLWIIHVNEGCPSILGAASMLRSSTASLRLLRRSPARLMSHWAGVPLGPPDPILGLVEAFKLDPSPDKVRPLRPPLPRRAARHCCLPICGRGRGWWTVRRHPPVVSSGQGMFYGRARSCCASARRGQGIGEAAAGAVWVPSTACPYPRRGSASGQPQLNTKPLASPRA